METASPLVAWTVRELKLLVADTSTDDFRRALTAVISWRATRLCLLRELPSDVLDPFRLFLDAVDNVQSTLVAALGRSFTGPQMTLQWRQSDCVIVPSQAERITNCVMNQLDGLHLQLADLWCNLSESDGLRFEALVEAVSATSCLFPGLERLVLIAHLSGTFVEGVAEVYRRQFQHARGHQDSDDDWDVMIPGPQTRRGPVGPPGQS